MMASTVQGNPKVTASPPAAGKQTSIVGNHAQQQFEKQLAPLLRNVNVSNVINGLGNMLKNAQQPSAQAYTIKNIKQSELSVFFSQYEDSKEISPQIRQKYLTNPTIMKHQRNLVDALVARAQSGKPPLTLEQFYAMARKETGDAGSALIVAHNVTKSLARGRSPIGWSKVSTSPLVYDFNGKTITFDPSKFHADALPTANGKGSAFYAMFSSKSLGTQDPGDWYHYFAMAAATYNGAQGKIEFDHKRGLNYMGAVDGAVDYAMERSRDTGIADSDAYKALRYANALSYLEGAVYGLDHNGTQAETNRESKLHRAGALFGLQLAGVKPKPGWQWHVPVAGSISPVTRGSGEVHQVIDGKGNTVQPNNGPNRR